MVKSFVKKSVFLAGLAVVLSLGVNESSSLGQTTPRQSQAPTSAYRSLFNYTISNTDILEPTKTYTLDLNKNGFLDIVVTTTFNTQIYENKKDGTFAPAISFTNELKSLQLYDIDNDGLPDLIYLTRDLINSDGNDFDGNPVFTQKVFWRRNQGNFVFANAEPLIPSLVVRDNSNAILDVHNFLIGNFSRNGFPTLFIEYFANQVTYEYSRIVRFPDGSFQEFKIGGFFRPIANIFATQADMLGVGIDVPIYVNPFQKITYVKPTINFSTGVFNEQILTATVINNTTLNTQTMQGGQSLSVNDLNNNGLPDIAYLASSGGTLKPHFLTAAISPTSIDYTYTYTEVDYTLTANLNRYSLFVDDMNGDTFKDMIISAGSDLSLILNDGEGSFDTENVIDLPTVDGVVYNLSTINISNSGNKEVLVTHIQDGAVNDTFDFEVGVISFSSNDASITVDLQGGTGDITAFLANKFSLAETVTTQGEKEIYLTNFEKDAVQEIMLKPEDADDLVLTDLFKEGVPSYLELQASSGKLIYHRGLRDGTFKTITLDDSLSGFTSMDVGDLTQNGSNDMVFLNKTTGVVRHIETIEPQDRGFVISRSPMDLNNYNISFTTGTLKIDGVTVTSPYVLNIASATEEKIYEFEHDLNGVITKSFAFITEVTETVMNSQTFTFETLTFNVLSTPRSIRQRDVISNVETDFDTVAITDLNGDRRSDVLLVKNSGEIALHVADGSGSFTRTTKTTGEIASNTLFDLTFDRTKEFIYQDLTDNEVLALRFVDDADPDELGDFDTVVLFEDLPVIDDFYFTHLNQDSALDFAFLSEGVVYGLFNEGDGDFLGPIVLAETTLTEPTLTMFDIDFDGYDEIYLLSAVDEKYEVYAPTIKAPYVDGIPTLSGFEFIGWSTDEAGENALDDTVSVTGNITVFAQYAAADIQITYVLDGATVNDNPQTHNPNTGDTTLNDPEKPGFTFLGWYDDADFTNDPITTLDEDNTTDITLYAKWEIIDYTITFVTVNGDNVDDNPTTYTVEDTIVLLDADADDGYVFGGWFDNADFTGQPLTEISLGSVGDLTLYAQFIPETYTITYEVGDGENDTNNPNTYTVETETITLLDATPVDGFTFVGWYESATFDGDIVTEISKGSTGDITLYAKYEAETFTITYELNGGVNDANNPTTFTTDQSDITLLDPTRDDYRFDGWFDNAEFTGNPITTINENSIGDKTLYAKWTAVVYQITYELNGGVNSRFNITSFTAESDPFLLDDARLEGYTFFRWTLNDAEGIEIIEINQSLLGGDIHLYANFDVIEFMIFYELGGGVNAANNPITYNIEDDFTFEAPTKEGATFEGWYAQPDFSGDPVTKVSPGQTGVLALYAKWSTATFTIQYEVFYVVGNTVTSEQVDDGDSPTEVPSNPTKAGYTFVEWVDVSGTAVNPSNATISSNTIFIASFMIDTNATTFTVTYIVDNTVSSEVVNDGDSPTSIPSNPTKSGYTFKGWIVNGQSVSDLSALSITSNTIAIAEFEIDATVTTITVYFIVNQSATTQTLAINTTLSTVPTDPSVPGLTFLGWTVDGDVVDLTTYIFTSHTLVFASFSEDTNPVDIDFLVQFVVDSTVVASERVIDGNTASSIPADPTRVNATFDGWFINDDLVDPNTYLITEDVVFVALFTSVDNTVSPGLYVVKFMVGSNVIASDIVEEGETLSTIPDDPTLDEATFIGWEVNGALVDPSSFTVMTHTVFIATFEAIPVLPSTYQVIFVMGDTVAVEEVTAGESLSEVPLDPEDEDGVFLGWQLDGQLVDPTTVEVNQNLVFVAIFEIDEPTLASLVTFVFDAENGTYIFEFEDGEATLNDLAYVSGTTISEVGEYTLLVTFTNGQSFTYVFSIQPLGQDVIPPQPEPSTDQTLLFISLFVTGMLLGTLLVLLLRKPCCQNCFINVGFKVMNQESFLIVYKGQKLQILPKDPVIEGAIFEGWYLNNDKIDLLTHVFNKDTSLEARFSMIQGPMSSKIKSESTEAIIEDQDDEGVDEGVTFNFKPIGTDTFYRRLTPELKKEFASMFMAGGSILRPNQITYRDGEDNTRFFNSLLLGIKPFKKIITLQLFKAIHEEMVMITKNMPVEQSLIHNALIVYSYYRRKDAGFLVFTSEVCQQDINLHRHELKTKEAFVFSYKRYAIILEKQKKYKEAVELVKEAMSLKLSDRTVGEYAKRLERIQAKMAG